MRFSLSVEASVLGEESGRLDLFRMHYLQFSGQILTCPTLKKGREAFLKSGPASNLKGPMGQGSRLRITYGDSAIGTRMYSVAVRWRCFDSSDKCQLYN